MLLSYLKIAIRYLSKNKVYTLINILGLAVGLTCSGLILLHVRTELSYDDHYANADNIYRLAVKSSMGDNPFEAAVTGGPLAIALEQELPEVIGHTRIREGRLTLLSVDDNAFYEEHILYADSNFFSIFDFDLVKGNPGAALKEPRSIALKEDIALKFFGNDDPVGRQLKWNNDQYYTVTAVIRDTKAKSHLDFDILVSFCTLYENQRFKALLESYFAYTTLNYILVTDGANTGELKQKIDGVVDKYMGDGLAVYEGKYDVFLQPLKDIYLHSDLLHEMEPSGNITLVYIFSGIAILILLIAGINFINLSTARSLNRALEVGLRKVFGANRGMVFRQFMGESLLTVLSSALLSILLLYLSFPLFNRLSGNEFSFLQLTGWEYLLIAIPGIVLIGLLSGVYPAMYLSGFQPVLVLKRLVNSAGRSRLRNLLVVLQFMISVFLLAGTFLIRDQIVYVENMDLGIEKKDIVVVSLRDPRMVANYQTLKNEMSNIPGVLDATGSSAYLGNFQQRRGFFEQGKGLKDMVLTLYIQADENYPDFIRSRIVKGRSFFENSIADSNAIVINEAYLDQLGWDYPLGRTIFIPGNSESENTPLRIVGVVEDFNYASLHQEVKPLIIMNSPANIRYLSLKINPENQKEILGLIGARWEKLYPAYPFEYLMQQSVYDGMYIREVNMGRLFGYFSVIGLFIAVLGLLGLSSYSTTQRTREIGIRKVLGSSVSGILMLITRDFSKWILVAVVISIPVTYLAMESWLKHFAFHTHISWRIFLFSGIIAFVVAYITIILQAFRVSKASPMDSLHYE